jgi:hypothetical protein
MTNRISGNKNRNEQIYINNATIVIVLTDKKKVTLKHILNFTKIKHKNRQ